MARPHPYRTLFLCTGNSARSILAESILNRYGEGRFDACSAGSRPAGKVNPLAIDLLRRLDFPVRELRSKSWDEFAGADAPALDFVFTVCDAAAGETCPLWPGQPVTAHWGIRDPAIVAGTELDRVQAFRTAFAELERRIQSFVSLPFDALDSLRLQQALDDIGRTI